MYTMKTSKIERYEKKVQKEVQRAIDAIYKKHSKAIVNLIAEQIPKGKSMVCGNGMAIVGKESGRAWGTTDGENEALNYIASLQYKKEYLGVFNIPLKIKSAQ